MVSGWPIEVVDLERIDLDLHNVRIPADGLDESAIASYLVEAEDLLELARIILRDGYLDNEVPVVVREDGRCVVLEGNRRITVLKAAQDPSLLGRHAPRMARLLSRYPETATPAQIRVMVAPSREAAQPLLARLHTGRPKKSWLREQQAVFYHAQLTPAMTLDDLCALYPSERAHIIGSFIRMGEMRDVIHKLRYDDRGLEEFVKTSQLKMTSFEYAYERPKIQQVLSLSFDENGRLASKRMNEGQRRGLMYLLGRFKDGTLNTRSPELKARSSDHDPFVEQLRRVVAGEAGASTAEEQNGAEAGDAGAASGQHSDATPTSRTGGGTGRETNGAGQSGTVGDGPYPKSSGGPSSEGKGAEPDGAAQGGSRAPNRGETRSRLDMEGFEYRGSSAGLRRRFEELRRLDLRDFPNATHDLLRTVLECAIKDHFTATGQPLTSNNVALSHCIEELARAYRNDRRMTSWINAVNRRGRMQAHQFAGTETALNASNHDPESFVTGREVHEAWERIKPILIEIVGK